MEGKILIIEFQTKKISFNFDFLVQIERSSCNMSKLPSWNIEEHCIQKFGCRKSSFRITEWLSSKLHLILLLGNRVALKANIVYECRILLRLQGQTFDSSFINSRQIEPEIYKTCLILDGKDYFIYFQNFFLSFVAKNFPASHLNVMNKMNVKSGQRRASIFALDVNGKDHCMKVKIFF